MQCLSNQHIQDNKDHDVYIKGCSSYIDIAEHTESNGVEKNNISEGRQHKFSNPKTQRVLIQRLFTRMYSS